MDDLRADPGAVEASRSEWEAWRAERLASVTASQGNLALIETRWLPEGETADPVAAAAGLPPTVTVTALSRSDLVTGRPEHGLRFWDSAAPAIQRFAGIDVYPYAPEWVVEADYTPVEGERTVSFEHIRDNGGMRDLVVPGDITFTLDGRDYALHAFDDGGTLLLVFGDPTNGSETYGAGRFLFVPHEPGSRRVILDFNRAFVPPCGFSDQYNCPMPPAQNRFHLPVRAGEKQPRFSA